MLLVDYKSTYEASDIIGVSYQTILRWIKNGVFTNIVYRDGFAGRSMMFIPVEQVIRMKEARENGRKRFRGYPTLPEEMPTKEDLRANKLTQIEDKVIKVEREIVNLQILLDQLKDL